MDTAFHRAVQAGFSAEVQMRFCAGSDADVVCVDTETRSLPPEAADALAGKVARSIAAATVSWRESRSRRRRSPLTPNICQPCRLSNSLAVVSTAACIPAGKGPRANAARFCSTSDG
jgi:hypothetical protein